eukprot:TRINITY_DN1815_c1_g1_i1.p1 TRINITY_DN1815_c1_g1~~TRINITY_DN1815_c1_g1_i1.p1  ORF type:complete len:631 (+),score=103.14 TRINITY_DN1815_c1_g1_i1:65-1957(+)
MGDDSDEDFQRAILLSLGRLPCDSTEANQLSDSHILLLEQQVRAAISEIIVHVDGSAIEAPGYAAGEPAQSVLSDLEKLLDNLAQNPQPGLRYRRLRISNPRIGRLLEVPGVESVLQAVGFERTLDVDTLEVPVQRTAADVRASALAAVAQFRSSIPQSHGSQAPGVHSSIRAPESALNNSPSVALSLEPVVVTTAAPSGRTAVVQEQEATLRAALMSDDAAMIMKACNTAEAAGSLHIALIELVKEGRQRALTLVDEALSSALASEVTLELLKSVSLAEVVGTNNKDLFRRAKRVLEKAGKEHNLAFVLAHSASSASGTDRHRFLAPLLSKVLAQKDGVPVALLNFLPDQSRAFSLNPGYYGLRGGWPYHKPTGWLRYALRRDDFRMFKDWCVAYHGTKSDSAARILVKGLRGPRRPDQLAHGQAGGTGSTIYLSPSVEYAAHPVYSQMIELGPEHWAQLVMECRVAPGSFRQQRRTLGQRHWPMDLSFDQYLPPDAAFEWLLEDAKAVVVTGLLVREFGCGAGAEPSLYGEAASQVSRGQYGVEHEWTRLRAAELWKLLMATPRVVVAAPHAPVQHPAPQEPVAARQFGPIMAGQHGLGQPVHVLAGQPVMAQAPVQMRRVIPQLVSR